MTDATKFPYVSGAAFSTWLHDEAAPDEDGDYPSFTAMYSAGYFRNVCTGKPVWRVHVNRDTTTVLDVSVATEQGNHLHCYSVDLAMLAENAAKVFEILTDSGAADLADRVWNNLPKPLVNWDGQWKQVTSEHIRQAVTQALKER